MNQLVSQLMNIASVVRDPSCARSDNDFCSVLRAVVLPLNGMPTSITLCLVVRAPVLNLGMLNGKGRSSIEVYIISFIYIYSVRIYIYTYIYIYPPIKMDEHTLTSSVDGSSLKSLCILPSSHVFCSHDLPSP